VTPLTSIMGSGFLVSAPSLGGIVGNLAVVCMALLLVLAYAYLLILLVTVLPSPFPSPWRHERCLIY
jgi:hypothetical protein